MKFEDYNIAKLGVFIIGNAFLTLMLFEWSIFALLFYTSLITFVLWLYFEMEKE